MKIGRAENADYRPSGRAKDTVSRYHAELLSLYSQDKYLLRDMGSSNGTYVYQHGRWVEISQQEVSASTRVRFGDFETTVGEIVAPAAKRRSGSSFSFPRRTETGEIIE